MFKEEHIHFHFFRTEVPAPADYFTRTFPTALDAVARPHFEATYPRVQAAYITDVLRQDTVLDPARDQSEASWWLLAQGFADVPDPHALVRSFLEKLDQALDKISRT